MELVQRSWSQVLPISDAAAGLFYDRLFEMDPSLRSLFKSDLAQQKKKLMQTLSIAVDGLNNPQRLIPVLEQLGARHAGYMVQEHHYGLVGEALLWTLREGLGEAFSPETESAWKEVYGVVAGVMKKAAASAGKVSTPPPVASRPPAPTPPVQAGPPVQAAPPPVPHPAPAVAAPRSAAPPTSPPNMVATQSGAPSVRGPVSPRSVELVQRSWSQVLPISDAAAGLFYDRLFEMDPSLRSLFKSDIAQQKKKLMQTLSIAVDGLNNPQRLIPVLEQLGARHAGYMVQEHHYGLVGEALLWTLREGLGEAFSPETESAWKEVYGVVAGVMKKAAASSPVSRPPVSAPPPVPSAPPVPEAEISLEELSPPVGAQSVGDETMPYPMLAQTRLLGLQPYAQPPIRNEALPDPRFVAAPTAAPATASLSIPLNVPREVTFNVHLNVKLEADAALSALALRATAPEPPAPKPAPVRPPPPEPPPPSRASVSPVLLVALCVLVSVSTVIALGPLGQAASSLTLVDLPRLAAPIFTLAALAVGYLWGRGRGSERRK